MNVKNDYRQESKEGATAVLDRMMKVIGSPFGSSYADALDINPNTVKTWIRRGEVPLKYIQGFAKEHDVSVDYISRGIESDLVSEKLQDEPYKRGGRGVATMFSAGEPNINSNKACKSIDLNLLSSCLKTCSHVYGKTFDKMAASAQLEYAGDLYNQLGRMSAEKGGLEQMKHLEKDALIHLLEVFIKLGWARKFPPSSEIGSIK